MEQYIETIAHLLTKDKVCSVSDIADVAQVSRPAASRAVRDLADKDLVEHRAYGYVDLTSKGQKLAARLTARHEALYHFLADVLQYGEEEADEEACRLEHQLDDGTVARLAALTEFLKADPSLWQRWTEHAGARNQG
jgi:DtxR family transcriptional regulator, Mn-dependent transcriptional regulator